MQATPLQGLRHVENKTHVQMGHTNNIWTQTTTHVQQYLTGVFAEKKAEEHSAVLKVFI